jgi:hypothetical protein
MMGGTTIKIVAALICDDAGRGLLVRKRGTTAFMSRAASSTRAKTTFRHFRAKSSRNLAACWFPAQSGR